MMGIFGWSYPPGVSSVPGDEECFCEMCGKSVDGGDCICPECPRCGEFGNPDCYTRTVTYQKGEWDYQSSKRATETTSYFLQGTCDLKESEEQIESRAAVERELAAQAEAEAKYWENKQENEDEEYW